MKLVVIANKLNVRKTPVIDFAKKSNIVGVIVKDSIHESTQQHENILGVWHKIDGGWVNEKWVSKETSISNDGNTPIVVSTTKESQTWFSEQLKIPNIWKDFNVQGEGTIVAVLDTGYDKNNADLAPNILNSQKFISYADSTEDIKGHGTRCASIIGCTNNFKYNIGIAPKSKMLIGKISNIGEINDFDSLSQGIEWAIDKNADIISISFGKNTSDINAIENFYTKINDKIKNKQILIFACCGNNYNTVPSAGILYPAAFAGKIDIINKPQIEKIISVGAIDNDNRLALLTLLNDCTIIHAPGIDIRSYQLNSVADLDSGTSISTPIIAGIAALAVSYIKKKNNGTWNAIALKKAFFESSDPLVENPLRRIINPSNLFKNI